MTKEQLLDFINCGREIEFQFNGKRYSITYGLIDNKEVISFCEFYQYTTEVTTCDELLRVSRGGVTVEEMLKNLSEEDVWIF